MGRRVVSPRDVRRRHVARFEAERRVPHRFDRAVVGGAVRRGRPGACRAWRWRRWRSTSSAATTGLRCCSRRRSTRRRTIPAISRAIRPACARTAGSTATRRCGRSSRSRSLGTATRPPRCLHLLNPDQSCAHADGSRSLQGRALRRCRRRLFRGAACRARRLDLVHGLGRLDVSRRHRRHSRHPSRGRSSASTRVFPTWPGFERRSSWSRAALISAS